MLYLKLCNRTFSIFVINTVHYQPNKK
ncbi:erythromycin resistance leader peptide [Enterococcus faecium]